MRLAISEIDIAALDAGIVGIAPGTCDAGVGRKIDHAGCFGNVNADDAASGMMTDACKGMTGPVARRLAALLQLDLAPFARNNSDARYGPPCCVIRFASSTVAPAPTCWGWRSGTFRQNAYLVPVARRICCGPVSQSVRKRARAMPYSAPTKRSSARLGEQASRREWSVWAQQQHRRGPCS